MENFNLVDLKSAAVRSADMLEKALESRSAIGVDLFALSGESRRTREVLAKALAETPDSDTALRGLTSNGLLILFNASAQRPGQWQLTRFDMNGNPWGDTQYPNKLEGIKIFLEDIDLVSLDDHAQRFTIAPCKETSTAIKKSRKMRP